jgi:hypothetical protein
MTPNDFRSRKTPFFYHFASDETETHQEYFLAFIGTFFFRHQQLAFCSVTAEDHFSLRLSFAS